MKPLATDIERILAGTFEEYISTFEGYEDRKPSYMNFVTKMPGKAILENVRSQINM